MSRFPLAPLVFFLRYSRAVRFLAALCLAAAAHAFAQEGERSTPFITTPEEAAKIALEIQSELNPKLLVEIGLPAEDGMRISLHHGPIFEHFDAVQSARTFYGTEVTVAARIEPRVPVGAIFTTQPFAAMIESDRNNYSFEYVGAMDLAKNYGVRILYRLVSGG